VDNVANERNHKRDHLHGPSHLTDQKPMYGANHERLELLREALPYIQRFKGKVFIIKLSGKVTEQAGILESLAEEIALCHQVGIRLVVVHGGGAQLNQLAERLGIHQRMIGGRRVTDEHTLEIAKMVFAGKINTDVSAALRRLSVPSVGLSGLDAGLIQARRRLPQPTINPDTGQTETIDYGYVGDVVAVNGGLLELLLAHDYLPVVCCLAADEAGNVFNINADTIAAEIARALDAEKLILLSDVDGIYYDVTDPQSKISHLTAEQFQALLKEKRFSEGMLPKAGAILQLIEAGRTNIHIVNGLRRNALLQEIFTDEGSGTMIDPHRRSQ
jgi:acetylglutamate kinase